MGLSTPQQHTCKINHNNLYRYLLNNYIVQKVKANNDHNRQQHKPQLNKRLTVLDIQDKATTWPQAKPHAGGNRKTRMTGRPTAEGKNTHTARKKSQSAKLPSSHQA